MEKSKEEKPQGRTRSLRNSTIAASEAQLAKLSTSRKSKAQSVSPDSLIPKLALTPKKTAKKDLSSTPTTPRRSLRVARSSSVPPETVTPKKTTRRSHKLEVSSPEESPAKKRLKGPTKKSIRQNTILEEEEEEKKTEPQKPQSDKENVAADTNIDKVPESNSRTTVDNQPNLPIEDEKMEVDDDINTELNLEISPCFDSSGEKTKLSDEQPAESKLDQAKPELLVLKSPSPSKTVLESKTDDSQRETSSGNKKSAIITESNHGLTIKYSKSPKLLEHSVKEIGEVQSAEKKLNQAKPELETLKSPRPSKTVLEEKADGSQRQTSAGNKKLEISESNQDLTAKHNKSQNPLEHSVKEIEGVQPAQKKLGQAKPELVTLKSPSPSKTVLEKKADGSQRQASAENKKSEIITESNQDLTAKLSKSPKPLEKSVKEIEKIQPAKKKLDQAKPELVTLNSSSPSKTVLESKADDAHRESSSENKKLEMITNYQDLTAKRSKSPKPLEHSVKEIEEVQPAKKKLDQAKPELETLKTSSPSKTVLEKKTDDSQRQTPVENKKSEITESNRDLTVKYSKFPQPLEQSVKEIEEVQPADTKLGQAKPELVTLNSSSPSKTVLESKADDAQRQSSSENKKLEIITNKQDLTANHSKSPKPLEHSVKELEGVQPAEKKLGQAKPELVTLNSSSPSKTVLESKADDAQRESSSENKKLEIITNNQDITAKRSKSPKPLEHSVKEIEEVQSAEKKLDQAKPESETLKSPSPSKTVLEKKTDDSQRQTSAKNKKFEIITESNQDLTAKLSKSPKPLEKSVKEIEKIQPAKKKLDQAKPELFTMKYPKPSKNAFEKEKSVTVEPNLKPSKPLQQSVKKIVLAQSAGSPALIIRNTPKLESVLRSEDPQRQTSSEKEKPELLTERNENLIVESNSKSPKSLEHSVEEIKLVQPAKVLNFKSTCTMEDLTSKFKPLHERKVELGFDKLELTSSKSLENFNSGSKRIRMSNDEDEPIFKKKDTCVIFQNKQTEQAEASLDKPSTSKAVSQNIVQSEQPSKMNNETSSEEDSDDSSLSDSSSENESLIESNQFKYRVSVHNLPKSTTLEEAKEAVKASNIQGVMEVYVFKLNVKKIYKPLRAVITFDSSTAMKKALKHYDQIIVRGRRAYLLIDGLLPPGADDMSDTKLFSKSPLQDRKVYKIKLSRLPLDAKTADIRAQLKNIGIPEKYIKAVKLYKRKAIVEQFLHGYAIFSKKNCVTRLVKNFNNFKIKGKKINITVFSAA